LKYLFNINPLGEIIFYGYYHIDCHIEPVEMYLFKCLRQAQTDIWVLIDLKFKSKKYYFN
jgi:hypothetical protein